MTKFVDLNLYQPILIWTCCQSGRQHAAGYDLKVAERTVIAPGEIVLVPTGVKAYMQPTEVLYLYDRSSNPRKKVWS